MSKMYKLIISLVVLCFVGSLIVAMVDLNRYEWFQQVNPFYNPPKVSSTPKVDNGYDDGSYANLTQDEQSDFFFGDHNDEHSLSLWSPRFWIQRPWSLASVLLVCLVMVQVWLAWRYWSRRRLAVSSTAHSETSNLDGGHSGQDNQGSWWLSNGRKKRMEGTVRSSPLSDNQKYSSRPNDGFVKGGDPPTTTTRRRQEQTPSMRIRSQLMAQHRDGEGDQTWLNQREPGTHRESNLHRRNLPTMNNNNNISNNGSNVKSANHDSSLDGPSSSSAYALR